MALRREEITRKLLHLFALLIPISIFYIPRWSMPKILPVVLIAFFLAGSVLIESLRFRIPAIQKMFFKFFGALLREEESGKTTGSTFIFGAALLCSIFFLNYPHIAFIALFLFILGDAIAALVGQSIGKIKIGKKSLEGSLACFLMCMFLFYAVFPLFPGLLEKWGSIVPWQISVSVSLATTILELIPLRITPKFVLNDNLAVPVICGFLMLGLQKILF